MSNLTVDLLTPTGLRLEKTQIPTEYTVRQIVVELLDQLALPAFWDGHTIEYSLRCVGKGEALPFSDTLIQAGVADGDTLKLVSLGKGDDFSLQTSPPDQEQERSLKLLIRLLDANRNHLEILDLDSTVNEIISSV